MRKFILLLAASLFSLQGIYAQGSSNVNHLNLCVGALYERGFDATLSYEHETKYHHSWEYFANAYIQYDTDPDAGHITKESFWNNYFTYNNESDDSGLPIIDETDTDEGDSLDNLPEIDRQEDSCIYVPVAQDLSTSCGGESMTITHISSLYAE